MNKLTEERLVLIGSLCGAVAIATLSITGAVGGTTILWWIATPFVILIPFLIVQSSKPDAFHLARIERTEKWIQRHPFFWVVVGVLSGISILYDLYDLFR
jgi:membrane protein DedA with SNARE-associated domain